ncbi:MAG: hypothetical protein WA746_27270 [Isosphaeraceae bacterium]
MAPEVGAVLTDDPLYQLRPGYPVPRGGLEVVWRDFAALAAIGVVLFTLALARFRRTVTEARS